MKSQQIGALHRAPTGNQGLIVQAPRHRISLSLLMLTELDRSVG